MNIRPLHDRVIVKRMEEERTSAVKFGEYELPDGLHPKKFIFVVQAIR